MTRNARAPHALDGHGLAAAMSAGTRALDRNRETINALNVFPVPDGDTGTNMTLTMQAVVAEVQSKPSPDVSVVARAMARSSLLAARGNSGLILAQFFKGLAGATDGCKAVDAGAFARALRLATDAAYRAVPDPREGTMLTVFREAAEAAESTAREHAHEDLVAVWDAACRRAMDAVRRTPEQLDVLREAGVVDAGGFGFAAMLAGGLSYLKGESDGALVVDVPAISTGGVPGTGADQAARVRSEFIAKAEAEAWGYCVSFAIEGQGLDPDGIRDRAATIGKSCVVAGDNSQVKVHLHTMNPGEPLAYAISLGTLSNISILNMDEQSRQWVQSQQSESQAEFRTSREGDRTLSLAVVAVVAGDGLSKLFIANGLGACTVVPGGDSMNPSTGDLLAAVEAAHAPVVIILPNNKNVVGTARQVADLTSKAVHVVPTTSIQAGISALLAFSPDQPAGSNIEAMAAAAKSIRAIAICRATRDSRVDRLAVKAGQAMGVVDGRLRKVGNDVAALAIDLLAESGEKAELATIYRGADVSRPEAERVASAVRKRVPGFEVEVVDGDQPFYPYLISVE